MRLGVDFAEPPDSRNGSDNKNQQGRPVTIEYSFSADHERILPGLRNEMCDWSAPNFEADQSNVYRPASRAFAAALFASPGPFLATYSRATFDLAVGMSVAITSRASFTSASFFE